MESMKTVDFKSTFASAFHLMECNSVVECCADNAEVVSSNLTIPIPLYGEIQNTESWQSGNAEDC